MSKGQYLVYERASRDEERLFIDTAKEIVNGMKEPKGWKRYDPKKHPGGRPARLPEVRRVDRQHLSKPAKRPDNYQLPRAHRCTVEH